MRRIRRKESLSMRVPKYEWYRVLRSLISNDPTIIRRSLTKEPKSHLAGKECVCVCVWPRLQPPPACNYIFPDVLVTADAAVSCNVYPLPPCPLVTSSPIEPSGSVGLIRVILKENKAITRFLSYWEVLLFGQIFVYMSSRWFSILTSNKGIIPFSVVFV